MFALLSHLREALVSERLSHLSLQRHAAEVGGMLTSHRGQQLRLQSSLVNAVAGLVLCSAFADPN